MFMLFFSSLRNEDKDKSGKISEKKRERREKIGTSQKAKNLLMPLFLMGCFPVDFQEVKRPLRTKSVKRPIKVGKRPINEGKRPIKAKVLVGVSVGSLMGCFRAPPPWRKTAPLKRPIKRSMKKDKRDKSGQMSPNREASTFETPNVPALVTRCLTGSPDGVATLKVRKGAFDALKNL